MAVEFFIRLRVCVPATVVERERDERYPVLRLGHKRNVVVRHGQQPREKLR